jgi:Flp pilus assembly protein TadD
LPAAFLVAALYMDLKAPFYCHVKAFYGLVALLPCCAFAAAAWQQLSLLRPWWQFAGALALGTWALVGYATYRVSPDSAQMRILLGRDFALDGQYPAAVGQFRRAAETDPQDYLAASLLANGLKSTGAGREAQQLIEDNVRIHPREPLCLYDRAFLASETGQSAEAVHFARQAVAAAPNYPRGHLFLTQELERTKQYAELEAACREALTVSPSNADLHLRLGIALAGELFGPGTGPADKSQPAGEAAVHLNLAASLAQQSAPTLNRIAWIYATSPIAELRNGALAVQLAETARRLASPDDPAILSTLAAAYAENGRFGEALTAARNLRALAEASNLASLLSRAREFEELFRRQQPYREEGALLAGTQENLMQK